ARRGVLFFVAAVAVTVLEVDTEILDRLRVEFVPHPWVQLLGQRGCNTEDLTEHSGAARVRLQRCRRPLAPLCSESGLVCVRRDVHSVYRLTYAPVTGVKPGQFGIRVSESIVQFGGQIIEPVHP